MKKLLAMFATVLILSMLMPVAQADTNESFFVGLWVCTAPFGSGSGEVISVLHLTEDHRARFIIQSFSDDDSSVTGRAAYKTWSASGNKAHVIIGENTSMDLLIDGETLRDMDLPAMIYHRVGAQESDQNSDKKGTTVGPGRYIIGKDIPPREYRFEQADEKKSVDVYVFSDVNDEIPDYFFIISKNTPFYAGLELTEGQVLRIEAGPVFMTSPVSLDFDW